ncbi:hypothetical protein B0T18DRAFT_224054 [Schizothecium vesticola]|uniref:Uncharacterized protein n=1 Tax=Schizothecium vesticola TaxID=314040 RepID=A0AA40EKQ9_9PEZI|nr:hypothetical protein B0T18DRAFT_224054 [Schizothecium vesticola]
MMAIWAGPSKTELGNEGPRFVFFHNQCRCSAIQTVQPHVGWNSGSASALCPKHPVNFRHSLNQQRHDDGKSPLLEIETSHHHITDKGTSRGLFFHFRKESKSCLLGECDDLAPLLGYIVMWLAFLHRCSDVSRDEVRKAVTSIQRSGRMPHISGASYKTSTPGCKNAPSAELRCDESTVAWLLEVKVAMDANGRSQFGASSTIRLYNLSGDHDWTGLSRNRKFRDPSQTLLGGFVLFCLGSPVLISMV